MINDIIDNSEKITVSKQITRIAKSQAMDMLQKKIFALELTIQKRMEQNHKTGGDYIPYRLSDERKNLNQLQERLGGSECLQVVLEYVWQRVSKNRDNGIRTWVWIDEFSIMFNDGAGKTTHRSGEFFAKVYKRIRKYGGVPTAITQNITEVLTSTQAKTMLLNSEFVVLLQQRKEDLDTLQKLFSLSPSQEGYLKTGKKGSGLIVCGRKIIPFEKPIPTDSLMYKICTTKFGEN